MAHTAQWQEKNRHNGTVKFKCLRCGRTISGPEKGYDQGTWILPEEH